MIEDCRFAALAAGTVMSVRPPQALGLFVGCTSRRSRARAFVACGGTVPIGGAAIDKAAPFVIGRAVRTTGRSRRNMVSDRADWRAQASLILGFEPQGRLQTFSLHFPANFSDGFQGVTGFSCDLRLLDRGKRQKLLATRVPFSDFLGSQRSGLMSETEQNDKSQKGESFHVNPHFERGAHMGRLALYL